MNNLKDFRFFSYFRTVSFFVDFKMKLIQTICRIFVGIVFTFSGFVKGVEPIGSTYKIEDYFIAFHIEWAVPYAFYVAISLNTLEFLVGISMLLGVKMKLSAYGALIFMLLFTPLTLILAITNRVTDCGCFGEALVLSNWQTFWKNIIILIPVITVFILRKKYKPYLKPAGEWLVIVIIIIAFIGLSRYCVRHLSIIDFTPYKEGTYIPEKMVIPPDAPTDSIIYEFTYVNKKTGEIKKFSVEEYNKSRIWEDTLWVFKERKDIVVRKGYVPPIHDFSFTDNAGYDYAEDILNEPECFIIVAYNLEKTNKEAWKKLSKFILEWNQAGIKIVAATSSTDIEIQKFQQEFNLDVPFYQADEIMLKTFIRSNPGLVLLKKGTIIKKWHYNDFPPDPSWLTQAGLL